jgi:tetratricopeptide (TPR) repeat protein
MKRIFLIPLLLAPLWASAAPDVSRPPGDAARAAVFAHGWAASRDIIAQALSANYQPGSAQWPGSTQQPAYASWLLLWKWCDLLARPESAETARFLARYVRQDPATNKLVLLVPGEDVPANLPPATTVQLQAILANRDLRHALLGGLLNADLLDPSNQPLGNLVPPDLLREWLADEDFSRAFFANLSPDDYAPAVLRNLAQIEQAQPDKFDDYRSLALAIAMVYDQKGPAYWPHWQVDQALVPRADHTAAEWFAFWVNSNESPGSLADLRTLSPEQAKFVVDAPLAESEFAWARRNVQLSREDFAQAFSSITYDRVRYQLDQYSWQNGNYTLAAIKDKGGICVDQAYYAMIAGKAKNLPTLFFDGQGHDGGHAWFGYLDADGHWQLDCGRYENQNFTTGRALDPQTWRPITDHELVFLSEGFHDRPEYAASQDDLVVARIAESRGQLDQARQALDSAIATCPPNPNAWDAKTDFLERTGAPAEELREHLAEAVKQFSSQPDLKAGYQSALAALAQQNGNAFAAAAVQNQIISQNLGRRPDVSTTVVAQQLAGLIADGKIAEAFRLYRQQIDSLGKSGGVDVFVKIVVPVVAALRAAGDDKEASAALQLGREALKPPDGSLLDQAFARLGEPAAPAAN